MTETANGGSWLWWSTGKDSAWALHRSPDVTALVTTVTPMFGRVAVHGTRIEILDRQAREADLPLHAIELPYPCSNEAYEAAVAPIIARAHEEGVETMAFGDLFLEDIRAYRVRLLEGSGVRPVFPLWKENTTRLADRMIEAGVEARIVTLDPRRLDPAWAGAPYDRTFLDALPADVDPCGENGEFHTCVVGGPVFSSAIRVDVGEVVEREGFVYADLVVADDDTN